MRYIEIPWSDNWYIENDEAWFCGGEINALFYVDMNSGQCELIAKIPECDFRDFRLYSYCVKYENTIFCLPNAGNCIWYYDLKKEIWEKIEVGNKNQFVISANAYRQSGSRVWLLEDRTSRIFEINLAKKTIEFEYNLSSNSSEVFDGCILVKNELYCMADDKVYCINIAHTEISAYEVLGAKAGLATICYDGYNFWISSFCKEIYVWNPEQGVVKVITDFPKKFGIYNFDKNVSALIDCESFYSTEFPFFIMSIALGKYIWFIPFQSNEILYIDKETYKINVLEIEGEQETEESLQRTFRLKYLVQYIREDRYIGLYSLKRQLIFEIDIIDLCVKNQNYKLSNKAFLTIVKAEGYYDGRRMLEESREKDQLIFSTMLSVDKQKTINFEQNIGDLIYYTLDE